MRRMGSPAPTTVWLHEPGGPDAVRGTLALDAGTVVFSSTATGRVEIDRGSVRAVRRHRFTPVLEVRYERRGREAVALFYFAEPPTLPRPGEKADRGPGEVLLPSRRHIERSGALLSMRAANRLLRRDIDRWVGAILEAPG
jgi:hypothetical protein